MISSNIDFRPSDRRVLDWDFLDPWPLEGCQESFDGAFSEDVLEHFYIAEQAYLLCNLNIILKPDAVARVLMPSYTRLVERVRERDARPGGFLHDTFGVASEVDAINMGMRFSGHRWLHDCASFARLASACEFDPHPTPCDNSLLPQLSGRNLRNETNSASFATDLRKRVSLSRLELPATAIHGATSIETLDHGATLQRATTDDPWVEYDLPTPLPLDALACLNVRSANLSSFRDHYYKRILFVNGTETSTWRLDETVKSRAPMNLMTRDQIRIGTRGQKEVGRIRFQPAKCGEYFTLGPLELFIAHPRDAGKA